MANRRTAQLELESVEAEADGGRLSRPTQAERRTISEERIELGARRLFARQGYTRTTLAQIGEEAGYSGALVSHRFGSKLQLFERVLWRSMHEMLEVTQRAVADQTGIDALCAETEAFVSLLDSELMRALVVVSAESIGAVPEIQTTLQEAVERYRGRIRGVIEAGMAAGEIRPDVDPAEAAVIIHLIEVGLCMASPAIRGDLNSLGGRLCELIRGSLEPRAATESEEHSTTWPSVRS